MTRLASALAGESMSFTPAIYARAVLNILEDFGEEKKRLEQTQRAVLNILDDAAGEKRYLEDVQRAVINILDDLDAEKRSAEEANRLKSEFLANMSHELRTPLNAIMGFAKLMVHGKAGPVSPHQHEFLVDILKSSDHLLQLVNDVLDLAKVESGKMEFHPEPVVLQQLVDEVRNILRAVSAARQTQIDTDLDPECAYLELDPARLKQILFNFLSNALKFTNENGRVTIRVRPEDAANFRLEVTDNGMGIRQEDIKKLFSEYRQLDSGAARHHQGTGLGLALTRRIVEAQGGHIGVRSSLGQGSTFFAVLPRGPTSASGA